MINPQIHIAAEALSTAYLNAANYPNIVFDNFLDLTVLAAVSNEAKYLTENIEREAWRFTNAGGDHNHQVLKRSISSIKNMTPAIELVCTYMNSEAFIDVLKKLTGIDDLVPDWSLHGGGLHVTYPGGKLGIHHDFNYTDNLSQHRMYRKVNLLIYLNENWEQEWGGSLELWYPNLSGAFKNIDLIYNRAVIFNIENAPHGHPNPLNCPIGENRRSLAFYYYSATPPNNQLYERAHWLQGGELV